MTWNNLIKIISNNFEAVFGANSDDEVDFVLAHLTGMPADPKTTLVQLQENNADTAGQLS
jgi:hypothetical protein